MRTIPEFPDYKISDSGTIFNKFGKQLKSVLDATGYCQVLLYKNKKRKTCKVHRLIAQTFLPNFYGKLNVTHKNKNRSDNRLINLQWTTRGEFKKKRPGPKATPTEHKNIYCVENRSGILHDIDNKDLYRYQITSIVWRFRKRINKKIHNKTFDTLEEAIAYKELLLSGSSE